MTDQLERDRNGDDADPDDSGSAPGESRRLSKWDRPPEPRDWRFFVGLLGKVLIVTGLLMFGFVGYQLWGTGIETARAQNRLEDQFQELVDATTPATTIEAGTVAPATTSPPATNAPPTTLDAPASPQTTTPSPPSPPSTAPAVVGVPQDIPPIERGQVLARLELPRIGKEGASALYVVPGVGVDDLKKGPGHYPDTPLPGQLGNAAIAGHRTTFGEPFRHIDELEPGDEIIVTMITGDRFVYEVTSTEIVRPEDYHVVATTDPTVATLTLTSCHPVYTARQRIIVHATLTPEASAPVGEPTYYDLEANVGADDDDNDEGNDADENEADENEAGDDPAVRPDDDADESGSGETEGAATDDPAPPPQAAGDVQDAFADGWFHDDGAWLHIALWGGALVLIAIAANRISRHFRRHSIGIACAVIPFVICLYFFYQNVNRLLPPGF